MPYKGQPRKRTRIHSIPANLSKVRVAVEASESSKESEGIEETEGGSGTVQTHLQSTHLPPADEEDVILRRFLEECPNPDPDNSLVAVTFLGILWDYFPTVMSREPPNYGLVTQAIRSRSLTGFVEHHGPLRARPNERRPNSLFTGPSVPYQKQAIERSWTEAFMGTAPQALKAYIDMHTVPPRDDVYGHFCAIVQSSGMGKSRLVDEFSRTNVVIPMNLRPLGTTGFPPADTSVRRYFSSHGPFITQHKSNRLWLCLLEALFSETANVIKGFNVETSKLAEHLHRYFSSGMTFDSHGKNRRSFYEKVVCKAEEKYNAPRSSDTDISMAAMKSAFCELMKVVEDVPKKAKRSIRRNKDSDSIKSTIFLSFDEAHSLSSDFLDWTGNSTGNSHMVELRRILHSMKLWPLFAFFISTTVDIWSPVSSHYPNASGQLWVGSLQLIPAFSNLGYDHLAYANEIGDGSHSLAQVTEHCFMANFGRPMWGLHAKHFPLKMALDLLPFAQSKLLNAINVTELTKEQKLACLSQRLSLEFDSKSHWAKAQERTQVECHLRMCLQIDEDSGIMASVSPSEPLVAEAAALSMQKFNSVKAMQDIFNDFSLHHGNRGEPLAMLLLTLARDNADPPIVNILQLIHALFTQAESVLTMKPTISPEGLAPSFEDTFRNAGTHFNHFLQLHQRSLCSVERLLELMSRGAFVLHANGQPDFDLCGAGVLDDGQNISKTNSFVILVQAQNDPFWTHKPDLCLFDGMDPYKLGILHKDDAKLNIPIIRVVFALGSVKAQLVPIGPRSMPRKGFTLYDIWCAGLSADIFCPVKQEDEGTWDDLLRTSRIWERLYKTSNKEAQILRRQLNPGAAAHEDHWNQWFAF